jgi:hypothetical protein
VSFDPSRLDFSNLDIFGEHDPRRMSPGYFPRHLRLNFDSAIKADVSKQNFSVMPRHWYIDATILCIRCRCEFCFSADEQKVWYEDYGFFVKSFPKTCKGCRHKARELRALRREYNQDIVAVLRSDDLNWKMRIASVFDRLCEFWRGLPDKRHTNRERLARQIARLSKTDET